MMCCLQCRLQPFSSLPEEPSAVGTLRCADPVCPLATTERGVVPAASFDPLQECALCPQRVRLRPCPQDVHVITKLSRHDEFALDTAHHTLDTLVSCESSDLLCELFRSATADLRTDLWKRMTACHPDRLDLLNPLFEQLDLPPLEAGQWPDCITDYRLAAA
ncbi:MAG TPA: hypothetical protein VIV61_12090 [Candidatus Ozemobacteraceae bacterium]